MIVTTGGNRRIGSERIVVVVGIALGAVVGLILGGVYYSVAAAPPAHPAPSRPVAAQVVVELGRSAAVAGLLAGLMVAAGHSGAAAGGLLGLALMVLPLVLLAGSVFHEGTPARTAALHAGDWVLKLIVVGAVVGVFV